MELTLKVNDDVARKIKGLSVLTGKTAIDITNDLSQFIDSVITKQIIESVGGVPTQAGNFHPSFFKESNDIFIDEKVDTKYQESSLEDEDEDNSIELATESLSDLSEEDAESMDDELPQQFISELEETQMAIKNKDGEDTGYEDELMADIQAMADDDEFSDEDSIMEDAAASMGSNKSKGAIVSAASSKIADDTPINDMGEEVLDVLPTDFGIDKVAGNDSGAVDFFAKALTGQKGDKSKRNGIKRKVIRNH